MSSFSKFNDIYSRMNILTEMAKGSGKTGNTLSSLSPAAKEHYTQVRKGAYGSGAPASTREAKNTMIGMIAALIDQKTGSIDPGLEKELLRYRNVSSQGKLVEFLKSQEINGVSLADIVASATTEQLQDAAAGTGVKDPVAFELGQRGENKLSAYKQRAEDRKEAAKAREAAKAAKSAGEIDLSDSFEDIADELDVEKIDETALVTAFIQIASNKLQDFEKEVRNSLDVGDNKFGVQIEAAIDEVVDMLGRKGVIETVDDIKSFIKQLSQASEYVEIAAELTDAFMAAKEITKNPADVKAAVKKPTIDWGKSREKLDDLEDPWESGPSSADLAAIEDGESYQGPYKGPSDADIMRDAEQMGIDSENFILDGEGGLVNKDEVLAMMKEVGAEDEERVDIWSLSPEQVSKLAEHMGQDSSIQDIGALIEYMAQDVEPDQVEVMLGDEARMLFGGKETVTESYTSHYMTNQSSKDKRNVKVVQESISFKERFKPKTSDQLEELRRYGL